MKKNLMLFFCLLSMNTFAMSAEDLLNKCTSVNAYTNGTYVNAEDYNYCLGYVSGAGEAFLDTRPTNEAQEWECYYKTYKNMKNIQVARVFLKYISNHPEQEDWPAGFIVNYAILNAFPVPEKCKRLIK